VKPNVKSGWVGDVTLTLTSNRRKSERTLGTEPRGSTIYRVSVRPWRLRWLPALLTRGLSGQGETSQPGLALSPSRSRAAQPQGLCITVSNFAQFHRPCSPKLRGEPPVDHGGRSASLGTLGRAYRARNAAYGLIQTGHSNVDLRVRSGGEP
jgi:hypothetical protein